MLPGSNVAFVLALTSVLCVSSAGFAQSVQDQESIAEQMKPLVETTMLAGNIPSLSIAVVNRQGIIWSDAYGYANVLKQVPAKTDTVYLIGSTFKTQSTMALLQLVDQGKVQLDRPVSEYIEGLTIEGEDPDHPILVRHLLTHTSGLPGDFGPHMAWGFTAPRDTDEYLEAKLKVDRLPDEKFEYSNTAFQLVSKIVETASGKPYRRFVKTRLWNRLDMRDTEFVLRPDQYERLAIPYQFNEKTSQQKPAAFLKADVWAAGMVYGTVDNQARWLMTNLNRGQYDGERIITEEIFQKMTTTQFECDHFIFSEIFGADATIGLTWWLQEKDGETVFAHSGSVPGYTAWVTGNLDSGLGVAILSNGHRAHPHLCKLAEQALDVLTKTSD